MARKGASIPINVKVTTDQGDDAAPPKDLGPLFSLEGEAAEVHAKTRVYRIEPIDEGHLDDIPPDADRKDVKRRWGGGTFRVQAVTERGKILSTDSNVKISGDPIFDNEVSRRRYQKWISQQFGDDSSSSSSGRPFDEKEDAQEARERRAIARLRTELEAKEAADERRRQREREDRKAEADEREAREEARRLREAELRREEREAERQARREEMLERLAHEERIAKADRELRLRELDAKGDPVQTMTAMAQIAIALRGEGGGGDGSYPDAVTAAAARLPEILREVREGEREAKGGGEGDDDGDGEKLTLAGDLAAKAKRLVRQLAKQGKSEEEIERILGTGMDALMRMRTLPQGARRTAAAPSSSASPKNGAPKKRKGWRPLKAAKPTKKKIAPKPAAKTGAAS